MADEDRPVTKKELDAAIGGLRTWIAELMEAQETRLRELMEAQGKRLLSAFHHDAEASHARIQKVETKQYIDGDWLTKLEGRVQALEERLDFPGQPRPQ